MSQATPTPASAAATEATYTDVPPATSSPGDGAGADCIASSATRSILSRTSSRTGGTRSPSRCDSVRGSHRHGAPERSYIATSLLSHWHSQGTPAAAHRPMGFADKPRQENDRAARTPARPLPASIPPPTLTRMGILRAADSLAKRESLRGAPAVEPFVERHGY